jgi:MoaA/NifB/PqqE/SkfB family radical SAM enzyme
MSLSAVTRLLPALRRLKTQVVLISGGEPLLNREWAEIARLLTENGLKLWLLTSGLALAKHARRAAQLFDAVTVSLDGTSPATYAAIRGVDAFDKVCEGIKAAADAGIPTSLRVTLQRANYRELQGFVDLGRELRVRQISFLAVDVANPHAFARTEGYLADLALAAEDLPVLAALLTRMEQERAGDFASGFIAESPQKLRRLLDYFAAVAGHGEYPPVRCNAPEFSAVLDAGSRLHPCFFIEGPSRAAFTGELHDALNDELMLALRSDIRAGRRAECKTCVCSMWRPLDRPAVGLNTSPSRVHATVVRP